MTRVGAKSRKEVYCVLQRLVRCERLKSLRYRKLAAQVDAARIVEEL